MVIMAANGFTASGLTLGNLTLNYVEIAIAAVVLIIIVVGLIAFRKNTSSQMRLSRLMDNETEIYNVDGMCNYIKRRKRKLSSPTIVVARINNLDNVYANYPDKNKLMYKIATCFLGNLEKNEMASRIDFDKFIIVYTNKNRETVSTLCHGQEAALLALELENYGKYDFSVSFGVFENPEFKDIDSDIHKVISALSYSKVKEKNISYYNDEVNLSLARRQNMNDMKSSALTEKKFVSYIQPKVSLKTGKVVGGEILVRWVDDAGNLIYMPGEFIPLFEENGFVKNVDFLMLENACMVAQTYVQRGHPDICISMNFSRVSFDSPNFVNEVMSVVSRFPISPRNIEIEVTESAVINNGSKISNHIMELRKNGFRVAMDDFGKEASSLGFLSTNPFDTIKMDMIFFRDRLRTEKNRVIVKGMLDILTSLNFETVCEGIEDTATLDILATMSIDLVIQGYVISKPIPLSEFDAFIESQYNFNYPDPKENVVVPASVGEVGTNEWMDRTANQINDMKNQMNNQNMSEIEMLRAEVDALKQQREQERIERERKAEIDALKAEIAALKQGDEPVKEEVLEEEAPDDVVYEYVDEDGNPVDVDDPFAEYADSDELTDEELEAIANGEVEYEDDDVPNESEQEINELYNQLEQERKEREELEAMLASLQNGGNADEEELAEEMTEEEILRAEEEANSALNLDVDSLGGGDDSQEDEADEEEEKAPEKPSLTKEEVESVILEYQQKYLDDWNKHAKEELKNYNEIIKGLRYYNENQGPKTLVDKAKKASNEQKQIYNIVKNEIMKYTGVTNSLTKNYDCFYLNRKMIAKLSFTSKKVRIYLNVNPADYPERQFPHKDVSSKKVHARTPYYALLSSQLSVRRITKVIDEMMYDNGLEENSSYQPIDYAIKYKFMKKSK